RAGMAEAYPRFLPRSRSTSDMVGRHGAWTALRPDFVRKGGLLSSPTHHAGFPGAGGRAPRVGPSASYIPSKASAAAQLAQHLGRVRQVPMLGEFAVFDAPDIDGPEREGFPGWLNVPDRLRVSCRIGVARHDLVAGNDAVLDLQPNIRHRSDDPLEILDLSRNPGRASARMLDIRFGEEFGKRTGIVSIHRRHVPVEKRGGRFVGCGVATAGGESLAQRRNQCRSAESPECKQVAPVRHVRTSLVSSHSAYIAMLGIA